jgi:hypothetical protein
VRAGRVRGAAERLKDAAWKPDFGPADVRTRSYGATAVGARDFLVAYNVNLNTTSTRRANAIAFDVREKGRRSARAPLTGKPIVRTRTATRLDPRHALKCVKGIGWFIEEYGVAQISMNLTNISVTPVHVAFDECCKKAEERGVRVTGSELVGLIPLKAMLDAGRYFLRKQQRSLGVSDASSSRSPSSRWASTSSTRSSPKRRSSSTPSPTKDSKRREEARRHDAQRFVHETASSRRRPAAGRSRRRWARWARPWARWSPTSPATSAAGTTAGRSSPTGPRRARPVTTNCCG